MRTARLPALRPAEGIIVQLMIGCEFDIGEQKLQILIRPELLHFPQWFSAAHDADDQTLDQDARRYLRFFLIPFDHPVDDLGYPGGAAEADDHRHSAGANDFDALAAMEGVRCLPQMTTRSNAPASPKRWDKSGYVTVLTSSKFQWGKTIPH
jgi:hypothetical protein